MGSKVRLNSDGRIGYVCNWKHDNDSGVTSVRVEFTDAPEGWFASTELTELGEKYIHGTNASSEK